MSENNDKNYPPSTAEIAKLLGLAGEPKGEQAAKDEGEGGAAPGSLPVADLPVAEEAAEKPKKIGEEKTEPEKKPLSKKYPPVYADPEAAIITKITGKPADDPSLSNYKPSFKFVFQFFKNVFPYLAIFLVGILIYYFFFSSFNFNSLFNSRPEPATVRDSAIESLQKQDMEGYNQWIASYYYDVSDTDVLDPKADNSGNGLTNFHKYLLNLNPKSYDTLGLGMADSEALARGINPLTGNALTQRQKEIIDNYFDMEVIMNKLAVAKLQYAGAVAGAFAQAANGSGSGNGGTGGQGSVEPVVPPSGNSGNGSNVAYGGELDINTDIPGRLEISSLGINVPIIWTKNTKNFEQDLKSGVVHYPGTALPGQIGTAYVSGHSSNYAWARGNYNKIFSTLGDLADNTSFKVTVVQKNGKDARLFYVVKTRQEYLPTDQAQFMNTGKSLVALSTCWPVGSTAKRLVVFGELTQVEK